MTGAANSSRAVALRERLNDRNWIERLVWLDTVTSTNDEARRLAATGAPPGSVVLADHQSRGRGRRQRDWDSPRGLGLYLSVLFRPSGPVEDATRWTIAGAVAACEACRSFGASGIGIKWPNDLLCDGRKLGGVLAELRSQGSLATELVLGTGLNLSQRHEDFPAALADSATSLAEIVGEPVDRLEVAARYLEHLGNLANLLERGDWSSVAGRWDALAPGGQGGRVRVTRPATAGGNAVFPGTTEGLDEQGALRVRLDDGTLETVRLVESVELLEN